MLDDQGMNNCGKKITWWSVGLGVVAVVGVGVFSRDRILEKYFVYKLRHGDDERHDCPV